MHPLSPPPPTERRARIRVASHLERFDGWLSFVGFVLALLAMPMEVLLRRRLGERNLDPLMILLAYLALTLFGAWPDSSGSLWTEPLLHSQILGGAFLAACLGHRTAILLRAARGEPWDSRCEGLPWKILLRPADLLTRTIARLVPDSHRDSILSQAVERHLREQVLLLGQPLLVLLLALAAALLDAPLAPYLGCAGLAMLLKGQQLRHEHRKLYLELTDRLIEERHQREVLSGTVGPEHAEGHQLFGTPVMESSRRLLRQAVAALDAPSPDPEATPRHPFDDDATGH